jgi:hypothetical protein
MLAKGDDSLASGVTVEFVEGWEALTTVILGPMLAEVSSTSDSPTGGVMLESVER